MLHNSIQEYLAKQRHRGVPSLLEKSIPRGWVIDIQFADELDELMMDELYDLKDDLDANLEVEDASKRKSVQCTCLLETDQTLVAEVANYM